MDEWTKIIAETTINEKKKKKGLEAVERAVKTKRILPVPAPWEILWGQMEYISPFFWLGEAFFFLIFWILINSRMFEEAEARQILSFSSATIACVGIIGIHELHKSVAYKMAELEQVCFLNLRQVWAAKMVLLAGVNLILLAFVTISLTDRTSYLLYEAAIYILVPFLISNIIYFRLLLWKSTEQGVLYMAAVFLCMLFGLVPSFYKDAYEKSCLWIWSVVLVLALLAAGIQVKKTLQKAAGGRELCLNYH